MDSHHIVEVSLQLTTCLFAEGGSALSEPSSTTACLVPAPLTYYTEHCITRVLMYHFPLLIHNALHITRYSPITHSTALPVRCCTTSSLNCKPCADLPCPHLVQYCLLVCAPLLFLQYCVQRPLSTSAPLPRPRRRSPTTV